MLEFVRDGGRYRILGGDSAVHVGSRSGRRRGDVRNLPYVTRVQVFAEAVTGEPGGEASGGGVFGDTT